MASFNGLSPPVCGGHDAKSAHMSADPSKQGSRYWHYSINELGMEDIAAQVLQCIYIHSELPQSCIVQIARSASGVCEKRMRLQVDHIHIIKTTELTAASLGPNGSIAPRAAADTLFRTTQRRTSLDRSSGK
jgi:SUMO ligase MMS21 Smc5/6 complex component